MRCHLGDRSFLHNFLEESYPFGTLPHQRAPFGPPTHFSFRVGIILESIAMSGVATAQARFPEITRHHLCVQVPPAAWHIPFVAHFINQQRLLVLVAPLDGIEEEVGLRADVRYPGT